MVGFFRTVTEAEIAVFERYLADAPDGMLGLSILINYQHITQGSRIGRAFMCRYANLRGSSLYGHY